MIGYATFLSLLGLTSIGLGYILKNTQSVLYTRFQDLLEFLQYAGVASIVVLLLKTFVVDVLKVPSGSMLPNYPIDQYIITKPTAFGVRDPWQNEVIYDHQSEVLTRGKVVISRFPYASYVKYLKRVVALPSDRISINAEGITINGELSRFKLIDDETHVYEVFVGGTTWRVTIDPELTFIEQEAITLAKDEVFLLGDNLTKSSDSRQLGPLKLQHIISTIL
jgi:signal peptidase I